MWSIFRANAQEKAEILGWSCGFVCTQQGCRGGVNRTAGSFEAASLGVPVECSPQPLIPNQNESHKNTQCIYDTARNFNVVRAGERHD
jgi:hypothetical protein